MSDRVAGTADDTTATTASAVEMPRLLSGKIALVTGAGKGIGRALSIGLARWGAELVVTSASAEGAERTAAEIRDLGDRAWAFEWDVSDRSAGRTLAERVERQVGAISILVNNAGIIFRGDSDKPEAIAAWDRIIAVNLTGTYYATMCFLDQLKSARGSVINIGSVQSFVGLATKAAAYASSKGAILLLTKELAVELAPFGVRVNAIAPGTFRTPINPWIATDPERLKSFLVRVPLSRVGEPDELVGCAVFLSCDLMSSYVTGVMVPVDGGFLAT